MPIHSHVAGHHMSFTDRPLPGAIPYTVNTPWRGVLHTTEGSTTSTYGGGAVAPQLTVSVQDRKTWQHYDYRKYAGKALKHPDGTPATNTTRCVQIEVIGYCDDTKASNPLHISKWTDEDYAYLNSVMRQVESVVGIARRSTVKWKAYGDGSPPTSYGTSNGVRLGWNAWADYSGWLGHQHVPGNVHGDPGNLDIAALLSVPEPPKKEDRDVMYLIAVTGRAAEFLVVNNSDLIWVQDPDHRSRINLMYEFTFGDDIHEITASAPDTLEAGKYGVLKGPSPSDILPGETAPREAGWNFPFRQPMSPTPASTGN